MKLRFRGNSLRLRLNRREVDTLAGGDPLREEISFPGNAALRYVLEPREAALPDASFEAGVIRVHAPLAALQNWASDESVGLYFDVPAGVQYLKISIEKDLECVDGPSEERDPEAFPRLVGKNC